MTQDVKTPKTRKIEKTIVIDAPAEAVWKALTDAQELTRWFPLDARVKPGKGGSIWISWGPPYEGENWIDIWDPPNRLHVRDQWTESAQVDNVREVEKGVPAQIAIDYFLESSSGKTVLRLVHSGFGKSADWDDEFDAVNKGWSMELLGLKHYLENHAGSDRRVVWASAKVPRSQQDVWNRVFSHEGFLPPSNPESFSEGGTYSLLTPANEKLEGKVIGYHPPSHFSGTAVNLNNGLFRIWLESWSNPSPRVHLNVWLSAYKVPYSKMLALQTSWTKLLMKLFPDQLES